MMRSFLFVPGNSERKLEKSLGTSADALIVDLEDSVALEAKHTARETARAFLECDRGAKSLWVRVNAFDTGMLEDDLAAIMPARPDGIMLPKSNSGTDVAKLAALLDAYGDGGRTYVIPIATETPQGLLALASYRGCSPRLWGLMWGAEDLASAIGATSNRASDGRYRPPFQLARDLCLHAAAAAGVVPIDAVFVDVKDHEGLAAEAREARADGFAAKAAIHPAHCDIINAAFRPTDEEVAWARAVLQAFAASPGGALATLDGKMLDKPQEHQARRIIEASA
jgi:citrate lyase subunit beta / citryl-CoA lyase